MEDHTQRVAGAAAALAAALGLMACASARRGEPLVGPLVTTDPAQDRGRLVFMLNCNKCHPGGEAGLGPALNNKPMTGRFRKFQVRRAAGVMPSFDKSRISDKELEDLTAYLAVLRKHSERVQEPFEARDANR